MDSFATQFKNKGEELKQQDDGKRMRTPHLWQIRTEERAH
jgi:hypothetical protein